MNLERQKLVCAIMYYERILVRVEDNDLKCHVQHEIDNCYQEMARTQRIFEFNQFIAGAIL